MALAMNRPKKRNRPHTSSTTLKFVATPRGAACTQNKILQNERDISFPILPGKRPTGLWMKSVTMPLEDAGSIGDDRSSSNTAFNYSGLTHPGKSLVMDRGLLSTYASRLSAALAIPACRTLASDPDQYQPVVVPRTGNGCGHVGKRHTHLILILNFQQSLATSHFLHDFLRLLQKQLP